MAKVTALEINGRDQSNVAVKKTYSNINPNASALVLKNFAVELNNLTTNSLLNIIRVDREDITAVTE